MDDKTMLEIDAAWSAVVALLAIGMRLRGEDADAEIGKAMGRG